MGLMAAAEQTVSQPPPSETAPAPELDPLVLSQLKIQMTPPQWRNAKTTTTAPPPLESAPGWTPLLRQEQGGKTELLDLQTDLSELLASQDNGLAAPPASSANTVSTPAGQTAPAQSGSDSSASARVISGFQLKAEQYQQLADRMGQVLAQRLQQQIDRGEWSLRLRLNPAELGQIDVQLDMQQGGLNAVFQTDNPLTRDLIQQGSGRLKEGLAQSGMTVATVLVNSDGSRQSGGNPTPKQPQRRSGPQTPVVQASPSPSVSPRASDNNWDMLV